MKFTCPTCDSFTKGLYPTLDIIDSKGVQYYCTCEICLNTCRVTACPSMLNLSNLTKELKVERYYLN